MVAKGGCKYWLQEEATRGGSKGMRYFESSGVGAGIAGAAREAGEVTAAGVARTDAAGVDGVAGTSSVGADCADGVAGAMSGEMCGELSGDLSGVPVFIYIVSPGMDMVTPELFNKIKALTDKKFVLCEYLVNSWDDDLTPWPCSDVLKGREFKGNADSTLRELSAFVNGELKSSYPDHGKVYVVGYSLAGLFSLYAIYEDSIYAGAVSCSGSLWYPGWDEFISGKEPKSEVNVYLSLGDKEPLIKNPVMSRVGDVTLKQYELLKASPMVNRITFEWNEGGHFAGASDRVAKGIANILG